MSKDLGQYLSQELGQDLLNTGLVWPFLLTILARARDMLESVADENHL